MYTLLYATAEYCTYLYSLMYNVTRAVRDEWTQADAARDHRLYQQPLEGL